MRMGREQKLRLWSHLKLSKLISLRFTSICTLQAVELRRRTRMPKPEQRQLCFNLNRREISLFHFFKISFAFIRDTHYFRRRNIFHSSDGSVFAVRIWCERWSTSWRAFLQWDGPWYRQKNMLSSPSRCMWGSYMLLSTFYELHAERKFLRDIHAHYTVPHIHTWIWEVATTPAIDSQTNISRNMNEIIKTTSIYTISVQCSFAVS